MHSNPCEIGLVAVNAQAYANDSVCLNFLIILKECPPPPTRRVIFFWFGMITFYIYIDKRKRYIQLRNDNFTAVGQIHLEEITSSAILP